MKSCLALACLIAAAALTQAAAADFKKEIQAAIAKLADQPNYSWTSQTRAEEGTLPWRQGPIEGRADKSGLVYFQFNLEGNVVQAAFNQSKSAINTDGQWEASHELTGNRLWIARRLQEYKAPAAEAAHLLEKTQWLKRERGGVYSANLTTQGVQEILSDRSRSGAQGSGPTKTKGTVKFWIRDGVLTKYEYNLQGRIRVLDPVQEFDINRTTTVELSALGSSKVELPEGARSKLE